MAKSEALESAHDTIRDIYDKTQDAGTTRADMEATLDAIAELCVEELPELDETEGEEDEGEGEDE